jgi:radical SAM superfamily enzyme YgiQ (UPF0313 family)
MNSNGQLCVKLIHCGNRNILNPADNLTKSIFYMPMGLFPMATNLKAIGVDVEILHLDLEGGRDIEEILDFTTLDAVGLDCHWINQSLVVMNAVELIKKIKPGLFIFLGGFTASFFAEEILGDYPGTDAVVRGDGEVPITALARILKNNVLQGNLHGDNFETVPNLAWRKTDGQIVRNDISYVADSTNMEQLDFAQVDLLRNWNYYRDLCKYWSEFPSINQAPMFFLEVGRGCSYNCSFCGGNSRAQFAMNRRKKYTVRSIDSVILTIRKAMTFGYSFFYTCFDFEGSDEWFIRLYRRIKGENLKISLGYGCWGIPSKTLIDTLSESSDQAVIEMSPETANLNLRKKNKDLRLFYTNKQMEECLDHIGTKPNLKAQLYFGYFLPFETRETVFETIDYIMELFVKYAPFTEIYYMNLSTDPAALSFFFPEEYDMDIEASNFRDYLLKLQEIYVARKEATSWLTLSRPRSITDDDIATLTKTLDVFEKIFSFFDRSILLILRKVNKPNILSGYLKRIDFSVSPNRVFSMEDIKNLLLDIAGEHQIQDPEITAQLDKEFANALEQNTESSQVLYRQVFYKEKDKKIITEAEMSEIRSDIQNARNRIQVEFEI